MYTKLLFAFISASAASLVVGCTPAACGCGHAEAMAKAPTTTTTSSAQPRDRHVYRLDFVVASNDPGKPPQSSAYTLNLEEYDTGEVHMGTNVPLSTQPSGSARMDVGLKIKASLTPEGDDLVFHGAVEMSSLEEPSSIRKITTQGDAVLKGGQPSVVASLEDPTSHKHFQVTAAATKLR